MSLHSPEASKTQVPPCEALPEVLATRAGYLLNRSAGRIRQMTEEALAPLGIIPKHYGLLSIIHANGPSTQQAIGDILKVDRTTMVLLVDDAESKKIVMRGPHPTDRRCHLLSLSEHGKKIFNQAHQRVKKVEEEFFGVLHGEEKNRLMELLGKLFQQLDEHKTEAEQVMEKS